MPDFRSPVDLIIHQIKEEVIMDTRVKELSRVLTSYSCDLKKGEKVLIDYEGECARPLVRQLIKDAYKLGARPYVNHRDSSVLREILLCADEEQIEFLNFIR